MTVLVAFASRHGATAEIAHAIAAALADHGVGTEVAEIQQVNDVAPYDAVVLGSGIYMGRWVKPAAEFVKAHSGELRSRPVWLFSSGPIGDPPQPRHPDAVEIEAITSAAGAREHLDRSELSLKERATVRVVRAPEGDYRDWDAIREWAGEIAHKLP